VITLGDIFVFIFIWLVEWSNLILKYLVVLTIHCCDNHRACTWLMQQHAVQMCQSKLTKEHTILLKQECLQLVLCHQY